MNKAISWKKDEHFSGEGKEYSCTDAYAKYETAMVGVTDDNGEVIEVDINDNEFILYLTTLVLYPARN